MSLYDLSNWHIPTSVDDFYRSIYLYFYEKGLVRYTMKQLYKFIRIALCLVLSYLALFSIKYKELMNIDKNIHTNFESYLYFNDGAFSYIFLSFTLIYLAIFLTNIILDVVNLYGKYKIYSTKLHLNGTHYSWKSIIERLQTYSDNGAFQIELMNPDNVNVLFIAMRILRKENVYNMLVKQGFFHINILPGIFEKLGISRIYLGGLVKKELNYVLIDGIWDDAYNTNYEYLTTSSIRKRCLFVGIIHLLFLPFILLILILQFIFTNTHEFKTKTSERNSSTWTPYALTLFREYNEYQHIFDIRINKSLEFAKIYSERINSNVMNVVLECTSFVIGAFLFLLLCISFFDDIAMTQITIFGHNLLYYFTSFSAILAWLKYYGISTESNSTDTLESVLDILQYNIRYKFTCSTSFNDLYQSKIIIFIREILSTIMLPYIFIFHVTIKAHALSTYIKNNLVTNPSIGTIVKPSSFDTQHSEFREDINSSLELFKMYYPNYRMSESILEII